MIFGLDWKSKTFRLFSPWTLCARGFLFVYLPESFLPIFRTYRETIAFIKMQGRVLLANYGVSFTFFAPKFFYFGAIFYFCRVLLFIFKFLSHAKNI